MMKETNPGEGELVCVDVQIYIYLKDRPDPLDLNVTFKLLKAHLEVDDDGQPLEDPVEMFMDIVVNTFHTAMNDREKKRLILSDQKWNKFLVNVDDIQAVSLMTPTDQVERALEGKWQN